MRILITGGTGLIGRHLCMALRQEGHELTVLSRRPASVAEICGPGVHAMGSLDDWHPDMEFDAVINLAGEPIVDQRWTEKRKQTLWDSRVALTDALVERIAAAERKPGVLISGSAIGYYGSRGSEELHESSAPGSDFPARLCVAWEAAALAAGQFGVRVCLSRTGLVLSPDGGLLARMLPPFRRGLGGRVGDGRQWMSWIHIEDCVAILMRLLRDGQMSGPYNVTAPMPVTNAEFTRMLATALNRKAPFSAPAAMLRLALGEAAGMLLEGQRVLPHKLERARYRFMFPELGNALEGLLKP